MQCVLGDAVDTVSQVSLLASAVFVSLTTPPHKHTEWVVVLNRGVTGSSNSLDCPPQQPAAPTDRVAKERGSAASSCLVCGGAPAVAAACSANSKCVAFVMDEQQPGCGYLKSSAASSQQVQSPTQTLYCNTGRGTACSGGRIRRVVVCCVCRTVGSGNCQVCMKAYCDVLQLFHNSLFMLKLSWHPAATLLFLMLRLHSKQGNSASRRVQA